MQPGKEQIADRVVRMACKELREVVPRVVDMVGESFTGSISVVIRLKRGGVDGAPRISLEF